jgi:DNA polymerase-3 subunit delta'
MHFEAILGHRDVKERLGRMSFSGRMGNAFLFLGPKGVGRKQVTLGWTQVLNCLEPQDTYPYACGNCRACRKIESRQFPDLFVIEPEEGKNLKIDQIREILRESHFKPYEGKKRVFIIDDAELLNDAAANALLKTLEEPAETLVLILIAEHEGQLLTTIRSRCQIVRFGTLPNDVVRSALTERGVSETDARWLANEAVGSLGRALTSLGEQEERRKLREEIFAGLQTLGRDPVASFKLAERFKKEQAAPFLRALKTFYRDAVVFKTGHYERIVNLDFEASVRSLADSAELVELLERFDAVEAAERRLEDFNANKQLVLERLLQEISPPRM